MGEKRTPAKFVEDWLKNLTIMIPLLSALGLTSLYGNSDTVKRFVHGSPITVDGKPEVTPINYDRIIKDLIKLHKKQQKQINANTRWHQ